jgi:hypothetical protein
MTKLSLQQAKASEDQAGGGATMQLSLFDVNPVLRLPCFPMHDLHGNTFRRGLLAFRPQVVADLRPYPYFNIRGLGADLAFKSFEQIGAQYTHMPFTLTSFEGVDRWHARQSIQYLAEVLISVSHGGHRGAVLLMDNIYVFQNFKDLAMGLNFNGYSIELQIAH